MNLIGQKGVDYINALVVIHFCRGEKINTCITEKCIIVDMVKLSAKAHLFNVYVTCQSSVTVSKGSTTGTGLPLQDRENLSGAEEGMMLSLAL